MRKIIKFGLLFVLVSILLSPTLAKADFNVAIGNTFTYNANKSNWDITYGTDSSTGTGFCFDGQNYVEGTQFEVLVTGASTTSVNWNMTVGSTTLAGINTGMDGFVMLFMLLYPLVIGDYSGGWNQAVMDLGPELFTLFFVDVSMFSEMFYEFSNETYISSMFSTTGWVMTNIGGSFDNSSAIAVFEWHLDMTYTDAGSGHNYGGTYTLIYAFDKTTGAMKGYYMNVDYSGQLDFTSVNVDWQQKVEQVGYKIPGAGGFIPGFEWFIAIPALTLLAGIAVIVRKQQK